MEQSRRSFLKSSSITAGTILASGVGASNVLAKGSNSEVRLRGDLSTPMSTAKIEEVTRQAGDVASADDEPSGTIGVRDMPDHHHVVAFNFDIIDGAPSSWVGVVAEPSKGTQTPDSLAKARRNRVSKILEKADRNAEIRTQRKQTTTTDSVTTQSTVDDWSSWSSLSSERDEIVGENGNETGYDIKWRYDPENYAHQAVETEIRMLPQDTDQWTADWQNRWADPYYQFNGSVIDNVSDYGPGNSIGTVTDTISLAVTSSKTVEVGASSSNTSSNVDIDNHSDTYGGENYVNQKFSISGDLKTNTVRVNQSACTKGTTYSSGSDYVNMDLDAKYRWGDCCETHKHLYDYRLYFS